MKDYEDTDLTAETLTSDIASWLITCGRTAEQRHCLFDAAGSAALLTIADASEFEGGDMPEADADQPVMS